MPLLLWMSAGRNDFVEPSGCDLKFRQGQGREFCCIAIYDELGLVRARLLWSSGSSRSEHYHDFEDAVRREQMVDYGHLPHPQIHSRVISGLARNAATPNMPIAGYLLSTPVHLCTTSYHA